MKAYVAGALLWQAAQAQLPALNAPLAGVSAPVLGAAAIPTPLGAAAIGDIVPPGTDDIVLPAASLPSLPSGLPALGLLSPPLPVVALPSPSLPALNVLPAAGTSLGSAQFGSPIAPIIRPLPNTGTLLGVPSVVDTPTGKASSSARSSAVPNLPVVPGAPLPTVSRSGFSAFSVDEPDQDVPANGVDNTDVPFDNQDSQSDGLVADPLVDPIAPSTPLASDGGVPLVDPLAGTTNAVDPLDQQAPVDSAPDNTDSTGFVPDTNELPVPAVSDPETLTPTVTNDPLSLGNAGSIVGSPDGTLPDGGDLGTDPNAGVGPTDNEPLPGSEITPIQAPVSGGLPGQEQNPYDPSQQLPNPGQVPNDTPPYDPFTGANDGPYVPQTPPIGPSGYDGDDSTTYDAEDQGKGPHGRLPGQDPYAVPYGSSDDVEDTTEYDGEDYGNGPKGQSKKPSKKPSKGNGSDKSGYETEEECPEWCLEEESSSSTAWGSEGHASTTRSAEHPKETGGKTKHKKKKAKKTSKSPHRIAVTVDDDVVYTSDYKREVADDAPSSGGFTGFQWPSKKTDASAKDSDDSSSSKAPEQDKAPSPEGSSQNDKEISDQLQKGSNGQRAGPSGSSDDSGSDSGDGVSDSTLPDWLNDLQKPKESGSAENSGKESSAKPSGKPSGGEESSAKPSGKPSGGEESSAKPSGKPSGGEESSAKPSGKPSEGDSGKGSSAKPSGKPSESEDESSKGKKKAKGKCPKSCKNKKGGKPSGSASGKPGKPSETGKPSGGAPKSEGGAKPSAEGGAKPSSEGGAKPSGEAPKGGAPTSSAAKEEKAAVTSAPDVPAPSTFVTLASEKKEEAPSTEAKGADSSAPTDKPGLPAGKADSGDTFTGSTLAGVCPKQCNPFNPAENLCDHESTGCTTAGGSKYYCACRAGYKLSDGSNKDFSKQFKVAGQPYVYTWPGAKCDKQCDDGLCNEVLERSQCV